MTLTHELTRLEQLDVRVRRQDVVDSLLSKLTRQLVHAQHVGADYHLSAHGFLPYALIKEFDWHFDEDTFLGHDHLVNLTHQTDSVVEPRVAQHLAVHILAEVLEVERVFLVNSESDSAVDDNVDVGVVVVDDLTAVLLDDLHLGHDVNQ